MKNSIRRFASLMAVVILTAGMLAVLAAASATGIVTYKGHAGGFDVAEESTYTATDLFGNFKYVMPGDKLSDTVTVQNSSRDSDFIKVYLRAVPHNAANKQEVQTNYTVDQMANFLNQLTLTVTEGSKTLFSGKAGETAQLTNNVFLAQIRSGKSVTLNVTLDVPITLGNEFSCMIGEVDWVFTIEEENFNKNNLIQTGQLNWPIPVLGGLGAALVGAGIVLTRKRKQDA